MDPQRVFTVPSIHLFRVGYLFLVPPRKMEPDILQHHLKIQHLTPWLSLSICSHAIWLMTLLLDLVQQAEAILLTALKQLIPCEVMEIQTVPAHGLRRWFLSARNITVSFTLTFLLRQWIASLLVGLSVCQVFNICRKRREKKGRRTEKALLLCSQVKYFFFVLTIYSQL